MPGWLQQVVYVAVERTFLRAVLDGLSGFIDATQLILDQFAISPWKGIEELGKRAWIITQTITPKFRLMVPVDGAGVGVFHCGYLCIQRFGIKLAQVLPDQQHLAALGTVAGESLEVLDGVEQRFGKIEAAELIPVQRDESFTNRLGVLRQALVCRTRNRFSVIRQGSGFHWRVPGIDHRY